MKLCKLNALKLGAALLLSVPCYAGQYDYHPDGGLYLGGGFNPRNPTDTFANCLTPFQTERPNGNAAQQTTVTIKAVKTESQLYREVGMSAELSGNYTFASGRAATQYSNDYAFDANSLTYVISARTNYGAEIISDPTLRADRANLPLDQLKAICGPEIVTQQRRGVAIFGVFTLTNISEEQREQFTNQVEVSANLGFTNAQFQTSYRNFVQTAAAASNMYMHVYAIGGPGITELAGLINVDVQTNLAETIAQAPATISAYAERLTFANSIPNRFRTMSVEVLANQQARPTSIINNDRVIRVFDRYIWASKIVTRLERILTGEDNDYERPNADHRDRLRDQYRTFAEARNQIEEQGRACFAAVGQNQAPQACNLHNIIIDLPQIEWPERRHIPTPVPGPDNSTQLEQTRRQLAAARVDQHLRDSINDARASDIFSVAAAAAVAHLTDRTPLEERAYQDIVAGRETQW